MPQIVNGAGKNCFNIRNAFHMRQYNLSNFPINSSTYRATHRSQTAALQKAKSAIGSSSTASIELIRKNVQKFINKEVNDVIQKYLDAYFKPGFENIRINNGENISQVDIQTVCTKILEEAKRMYQTEIKEPSPCLESSDVENTIPINPVKYRASKQSRKKKNSDSDSETYNPVFKPRKKKGRPPLHTSIGFSVRAAPSKLPVKREGPKWDPDRILMDTEFIMGAKANKALGLGATRGRIYIKHPDIFKYSGDPEDKQWLCDHNLMPPIKGKAYMLLVEDIQDLAESDEYKNSPGLLLHEIVGFKVPDYMLKKIKLSMQSMRTDVTIRKRGRSAHDPEKSDAKRFKGEESNDFYITGSNSINPSPLFDSTEIEDTNQDFNNGLSPLASDLSNANDSLPFEDMIKMSPPD